MAGLLAVEGHASVLVGEVASPLSFVPLGAWAFPRCASVSNRRQSSGFVAEVLPQNEFDLHTTGRCSGYT